MASKNVCEPCFNDGKQATAIKWCMECQEAICKDCTDSHRKLKYIKHHRLIDIDEKLETVKFDVKKCEKHPKFEEEYYCSDHDVTCCRDCLAKDHKACPGTVSVESAAKGIRKSEILNECASITTTMSKAFDDIIQFCKENKQDLETDADKIKDEVDRLEAEYIKQIKNMKRTILDNIEKSKHEKGIQLSEKSEKAQSVKAILDNHQKKLNFVQENGSERQLFLFLRQSESNLSECENALHSTLSKTHKVKLSLNKLPLCITEIGSVKVTETECPIKYVPPKHYQAQFLMPIAPRLETFELVDRISTPDSCITAMAVTEDNKLLTCNRSSFSKNSGLNVFDQNNTFYKTVQMRRSDPWDITIIPNNSDTAVVTFKSDQIQFLDTKSLQPGKVVTVGFKCSGIASSKENILVGSDWKIFVLTVGGTVQRTVSLPDHEEVRYIHVDDKDRIHYSDFTQIRCITTDGKPIYSYKIEGEYYHRSIATDHHGYVYIIGETTNQVVRLTPTGCTDSIILNKDKVINNPLALCFNKSCDKLYVSNLKAQDILIRYNLDSNSAYKRYG